MSESEKVFEAQLYKHTQDKHIKGYTLAALNTRLEAAFEKVVARLITQDRYARDLSNDVCRRLEALEIVEHTHILPGVEEGNISRQGAERICDACGHLRKAKAERDAALCQVAALKDALGVLATQNMWGDRRAAIAQAALNAALDGQPSGVAPTRPVKGYWVPQSAHDYTKEQLDIANAECERLRGEVAAFTEAMDIYRGLIAVCVEGGTKTADLAMQADRFLLVRNAAYRTHVKEAKGDDTNDA